MPLGFLSLSLFWALRHGKESSQVNPAARDGGAAASSSAADQPDAVVRAAERRKAAMVAAAAGLSEIERLRQTTHTARAELKQAEVSRERAKADLRALEVTHAQDQAIAHREADAAARRAAEVAPTASFAALEARRAAEAVDEAVSAQQGAAGRMQWARAKLALLTDAAQREAVQHAIDARTSPHLPQRPTKCMRE